MASEHYTIVINGERFTAPLQERHWAQRAKDQAEFDAKVEARKAASVPTMAELEERLRDLVADFRTLQDG